MKKDTRKLSFTQVDGKVIEASFDGGAISSDAGALFIREAENYVGIIKAISSCITDDRDARYVKQLVKDIVYQRTAQITCGYEDANDCNELRHDPFFKMGANRCPIEGDPLASQPTVSRLENMVRRTDILRIFYAITDNFIDSYISPPSLIVLDFDTTADEVHGAQQLRLYDGYYSEYCYQPLHVYEGLSGKLIASVLRPGQRVNGQEVVAILKRIVKRIRRHWKHTAIVFRGDSHFSSPVVHEWIDDNEDVDFVIGQSGNAVLYRMVEDTLEKARKLYREKQKKVKLYKDFYYQADSWRKRRRIIAKVEISDEGENRRFVVTSFKDAGAQGLYETIYCGRGNAENYIKNHKVYTKSDRTSCHRFEANQVRLFLHSAAYILLHAIQKNLLKGTRFANATFETIRLRILKIGAQVRELKTRIKVHLSSSYPLKPIFERMFDILQSLPAPSW